MTENHALASALSRFSSESGHLVVGGRTAASLAEEHGTPLYLYSRDVVLRRHDALRACLPEGVQIYYAVKANPHGGVLALMGGLYDGFDVSSMGEMKKALDAGISPAAMSYAGPGKRVGELDFAVSHGIGSLSIESERELQHVSAICREKRSTARVMIRVNPDFAMNQSGMGMGGARQFGIDAEQVPAVLARVRNDESIDFQGIHVFSGSQNLNAPTIVEHFARIVGYALDTCARADMPLKVINIGGGLGIPYFSHEQDLDLDVVGRGLEDILHRHAGRLKDTRIRMELGRYLVGECGVYLCRVLYRKTSHGRVFIVIDGGMHHNLAASGNLGQGLARRPMPVTVANRLDGPREQVTVVGPLCTPLDTFGTVEIPHAEEGDLVAVMSAGAYGLTASPVFFLSHDLPREVLL
ncbi:MAG TPA: type III PLP-dependent enzyme [bacterium]|nr:type III PLP-dependent enzyme [bacterium]